MDAERTSIAKVCLNGAHDGSLSFPEIVGKLLEAGFESYSVDFRRGSQTFYLPDGDYVDLAIPHNIGAIAAGLDGVEVEKLVAWAQADGPGYSYASFSQKVKTAGCAGYLVSFSGRRVVYYGRTAGSHVELFPQ